MSDHIKIKMEVLRNAYSNSWTASAYFYVQGSGKTNNEAAYELLTALKDYGLDVSAGEKDGDGITLLLNRKEKKND